MSETLLHCFACDAFSPQSSEDLVCSQCQSDFVEIVQVERSPFNAGVNHGSQSQHSQSGANASADRSSSENAPGFTGMLSSLLTSILPQAATPQNETRHEGDEINRPESPGYEEVHNDHPAHQIPPFNDFFAQIFGQLPQAQAQEPSTSRSAPAFTRTTYGPNGMTFTFTSTMGSNQQEPSFFPTHPYNNRNPSSAAPPYIPGFFSTSQGDRPVPGIPDLATFLAQALGAVPGTAAGDYASGVAFDNIISELMNRNPTSNVRPADEAAIAQIRRIKLDRHEDGLASQKIGEECSICQEEYCEEEVLAELKCRHIYHDECLMNWVKTNAVCPICRAPVVASEESVDQDDLD